jgi:hypothetical protein
VVADGPSTVKPSPERSGNASADSNWALSMLFASAEITTSSVPSPRFCTDTIWKFESSISSWKSATP